MYLKYLSNIFVKVVRSMDNNTRTKDNEENEETNYKYKCEECGINFGNSIGDMELHKLTVHLQKGDMELK